MAAASHRDRKAARPSELHRCDDVNPGAARTIAAGAPVERAVPDLAVQVVVRTVRTNDRPAKGGVIDLELVGDGGHGRILHSEPERPAVSSASPP